MWWASPEEVSSDGSTKRPARPCPLERPLVAGCKTRSGHCVSSKHIPVVFFLERLRPPPPRLSGFILVSHLHDCVHTASDDRAGGRLKMEFFLPERIQRKGRGVKNRHTTDEEVWVRGGSRWERGALRGRGRSPLISWRNCPGPRQGVSIPERSKVSLLRNLEIQREDHRRL